MREREESIQTQIPPQTQPDTRERKGELLLAIDENRYFHYYFDNFIKVIQMKEVRRISLKSDLIIYYLIIG